MKIDNSRAKTCSKCGKSKPRTDFTRSNKYKDGLRCWCTLCESISNKMYHTRERARVATRHKAYNYPYKSHGAKRGRVYTLWTLYRLTRERYDQMVLEQEGRCAICGIIPDYDLCVDHDHATNLTRALLCRTCNWGLGQFKDNSELLAKAIIYLERYRYAHRQFTDENVAHVPVQVEGEICQ